jgi:hypothetical protein
MPFNDKSIKKLKKDSEKIVDKIPEDKKKVEVKMIASASIGRDQEFTVDGGEKKDGVYVVNTKVYNEIRRSCVLVRKTK